MYIVEKFRNITFIQCQIENEGVGNLFECTNANTQ